MVRLIYVEKKLIGPVEAIMVKNVQTQLTNVLVFKAFVLN